jgi:hypothetical protein
MVTGLQLGIALTVTAYLAMFVVVVHSKYVVERIAAGEYELPGDRRNERGPS